MNPRARNRWTRPPKLKNDEDDDPETLGSKWGKFWQWKEGDKDVLDSNYKNDQDTPEEALKKMYFMNNITRMYVELDWLFSDMDIQVGP